MSQSEHNMKRDRGFSSGWEEFYCPACGRRFMMRWPPSYAKIVLEPGDEQVTHYYATDDLSVTTDAGEEEDPGRLKPFEDYFSRRTDDKTESE